MMFDSCCCRYMKFYISLFLLCYFISPLRISYYERIFSYIAYPRPLRVKFRQVYFIWEICQVMLDRANYFLSIKDLTLISFLGILLPAKFCFKIWLICVLFYLFISRVLARLGTKDMVSFKVKIGFLLYHILCLEKDSVICPCKSPQFSTILASFLFTITFLEFLQPPNNIRSYYKEETVFWTIKLPEMSKL